MWCADLVKGRFSSSAARSLSRLGGERRKGALQETPVPDCLGAGTDQRNSLGRGLGSNGRYLLIRHKKSKPGNWRVINNLTFSDTEQSEDVVEK